MTQEETKRRAEIMKALPKPARMLGLLAEQCIGKLKKSGISHIEAENSVLEILGECKEDIKEGRFAGVSAVLINTFLIEHI